MENPPSTKPKEFLSIQEAADFLGMSYPTVYKHVRLGKIPATQIGTRWRIKREKLEALFD